MTGQEKLVKSAGGIGLATLASRILGLIRDVLIASRFGTGIYATVFVAAFRIPNLFRRLLGEGALFASFIPVFSEYLHQKGKKEAWQLARAIFHLLLLILLGITLLGIFGAPFIARIIVPGFAPDQVELTARLLRLLFPYLLFIGLAALAMSILNSFKHFVLPAIAPLVLNLTMIISLIFFVKAPDFSGIRILSLAILIGGLGQLLIQIPALLKKGMPIKIRSCGAKGSRVQGFKGSRMKHLLSNNLPQTETASSLSTSQGVRKIVLLMGPAALGLAVYQINIVVDTIFASYESIVGEGAIAALYFGNRLMQFPLAIFGIAMATAIFPTLAGQVSQAKIDKLKETLLLSLRVVFFLIIPASVGLIVLGRPIVSLLFERGAFGARAVQDTVTALSFYSLGLFAFAGIHITSRVFFSLQDTKTPVKVACLTLLINIALNLAFMHPLRLGGLALATSLAAGINFGLLLYLLSKKIGGINGKAILSSLSRIMIISLFMGLICYLVARGLRREVETISLAVRFFQVFIPILAGIVTLAITSFLFKFEEVKLFRRIVFRQRERG